MFQRSSTGGAGAVLFTAWLVSSGSAAAQTPAPTPEPARLGQDELDQRGRSSIVLGSGARAYGMGGAFLARADDATAASWNPAGLSYLRRPELSIVGVRNSAHTQSVSPSGPVTTDEGVGYAPDFAAATYPASLGRFSGAVQASFQRVVSYGTDRTIAKPGNVARIKSRGGFDVAALGAGFRLTEGLRAGVTFNRWFNGYTGVIDRDRALAVSSVQDAELDLTGWNVNAGLIWTPLESLNLGLVGKTPFTADASLRRTRRDRFPVRPNAGPGAVPTFTANAHAAYDLQIDFPGALGAGMSWRPRSELTVSLDVTRTFWTRSVIRNYFTLPPNVSGGPRQPPEAPEDLFSSLPYPTLDDPGQNDSQQVRAGFEYVLLRSRLRVPLRAGVFTDRQIFRDARDRSPTFIGFTVGAGLLIGPVLLDIAFLDETGNFLDRSQFAAQNVTTRRVLASMIYRHGASR